MTFSDSEVESIQEKFVQVVISKQAKSTCNMHDSHVSEKKKRKRRKRGKKQAASGSESTSCSRPETQTTSSFRPPLRRQPRVEEDPDWSHGLSPTISFEKWLDLFHPKSRGGHELYRIW